jgi:hypothetical protein
MRRQKDDSKKVVKTADGRTQENVVQSSGKEVPSRRRELSIPEIRSLWNGLEIRVGLFRVSGERSAVAAAITLLGFILLVDEGFLIGGLLEGGLGVGLVWMLTHNAKS